MLFRTRASHLDIGDRINIYSARRRTPRVALITGRLSFTDHVLLQTTHGELRLPRDAPVEKVIGDPPS